MISTARVATWASADDQQVDRRRFLPMGLVLEHDRPRRGSTEHDQAGRIVGFHNRHEIEEERKRPEEDRAADHIRIECDELTGEAFQIAAAHVPHLISRPGSREARSAASTM
jgi:hypothetical protein